MTKLTVNGTETLLEAPPQKVVNLALTQGYRLVCLTNQVETGLVAVLEKAEGEDWVQAVIQLDKNS